MARTPQKKARRTLPHPRCRHPPASPPPPRSTRSSRRKRPARLSKRLNLRNRVRTIEYTRTGSDFESHFFSTKPRAQPSVPKKLAAAFAFTRPISFASPLSHEHPRVYATNRLSKKSLAESFGPFPSRAAADRYCDAVLDLFLLRRCYEDLEPYPEHPGCVYGEMHKCMEPCKQACTPDQYSAEAQRIFAFFATRGESLLTEVARERDAASDNMDFETAANLHKHWEKVRAAALLADELIRPVTELRAIIPSGVRAIAEDKDAVPHSLRLHARQRKPLRPRFTLSTLGVRAVREQTAVGSSLFAQPLMLAPVPLDNADSVEETRDHSPSPPKIAPRATLEELTTLTSTPAPLDELMRRSLPLPPLVLPTLKNRRSGEVFLPSPDTTWPIRRILNGAARVSSWVRPPKHKQLIAKHSKI